jgi:hypothetical protein
MVFERQAIDSNGLFSKPFIFEGTMNADLYLNECLKKRLMPFIQKNYPDKNILFWSDLATAHYSLSKQVHFIFGTAKN